MDAVQGTVATFDESRHHGSLLLDDGSAVEFGADAFEASGLRLLRIGQRVRVERGDAGRIVRITIPTLP
jgi:cold shock CspA family protein